MRYKTPSSRFVSRLRSKRILSFRLLRPQPSIRHQRHHPIFPGPDQRSEQSETLDLAQQLQAEISTTSFPGDLHTNHEGIVEESKGYASLLHRDRKITTLPTEESSCSCCCCCGGECRNKCPSRPHGSKGESWFQKVNFGGTPHASA